MTSMRFDRATPDERTVVRGPGIYFSKAQLQRCPSLFSHGKCRLSRTTVLTSGQIGGDRRARAVGRDLLHRGSRAIEAERDPVARAVVDSQTRSAQTLAARQRRRDAVSTAAPRSSLQNSSTYAKDIA